MAAKIIVVSLSLLFYSFGCKEPPLPESDLREKIVILGSSTASGYGLAEQDSSWVNRLAKKLNHQYQIINLSRAGLNSYHFMPQNSEDAGRPLPDTTRNIDKALRYYPKIIIINLPSNDIANGFTISEFLSNLHSIDSVASCRDSVTVLVCTTQPRNLILDLKERLRICKDSIAQKYGARSVDFWSPLTIEQNQLNPLYDSGDGVHLNSDGHKLLFQQALSALENLHLLGSKSKIHLKQTQ